MEKKTFRLNLKSLELGDIIATAADDMESFASEKDVEIKTSVQEDLPMVEADYTELKHVITHLLDNAIKFNKKGGEVFIEATHERNFIKVRISDTGVGIPEKNLDKVFDILYQIDASTIREYSGTGMGLAVVKKIIEAHGGKIWVESELGRWTRFTFRLPAVAKG